MLDRAHHVPADDRPGGTPRGAAPALLPVLARGRHRTPRSGACFMEMASFLAGERWSDHPSCTHPLLAQLAREVNDRTSDDARPRLGLLVPSVVALVDDDPATDVRLALLCARTALPVAPEERQRSLAVALLAGEEVLAQLEGRPPGDVDARSRDALDRVPLAAAWARRFAAGTLEVRATVDPRTTRGAGRTSVRSYRRHGAPFAVTSSVRGVAGACGVDTDAVLHDLLAAAVELVARRPLDPPVPDPRWVEACRLTGARGPV